MLYSRGNLSILGSAEGRRLVRKLYPYYISLLFQYLTYIIYIDMNKNQLILLVVGIAVITGLVYQQQIENMVQGIEESASLTIDQKGNLGLPDKIVAGEVHYSRIPVEYWDHRLQLIKSMGFNALSIYIMWNYHETEREKFDYTTGNKNLGLFLELAKKYNMYVLIRPGPYVCAEWDLGGFPARMLNINGLKFRANNQVYLDQVKIYFQSLVPVLKPYWASNRGPIVLLQIENEYGFYGNDKTYIEALRQMWRDLGVNADEYYVDTAQNLEKCHWSGANIGINDGIAEEQYVYARTLEKKGMIFGGEIYSGWLTHWGENYQGKSLVKYNQQFGFLFGKNHSFSMYMVHGGTNFGLTAGANADGGTDYRGHITSYDYDAPIDEQGAVNEKFYSFREMAKKYVPWEIPEPPQPIKAISIPAFRPIQVATLFSNLPAPSFTKSATAYLFESNELQMYNQGFVYYETILAKDVHYVTLIVRDFAVVALNGNFLTSLDRSISTKHNLTLNCSTGPCTLSILVEAMGHINFDHQMETDKKGLFFFNDTRATKFEWNIYKINVNEDITKWRMNTGSLNFPTLFRGSFSISEVGDTFINLSKYKKGYVWVNGNNLGRYWNRGPTSKLFCPGAWLKSGHNEIYILELLTDNSSDLTGDKTLKG